MYRIGYIATYTYLGWKRNNLLGMTTRAESGGSKVLSDVRMTYRPYFEAHSPPRGRSFSVGWPRPRTSILLPRYSPRYTQMEMQPLHYTPRRGAGPTDAASRRCQKRQTRDRQRALASVVVREKEEEGRAELLKANMNQTSCDASHGLCASRLGYAHHGSAMRCRSRLIGARGSIIIGILCYPSV